MTSVLAATCDRTGKIRYTRKEAMRRAATWRARLTRMAHYRCHACGGWHIGHRRRKPVNRGRRGR